MLFSDIIRPADRSGCIIIETAAVLWNKETESCWICTDNISSQKPAAMTDARENWRFALRCLLFLSAALVQWCTFTQEGMVANLWTERGSRWPKVQGWRRHRGQTGGCGRGTSFPHQLRERCTLSQWDRGRTPIDFGFYGILTHILTSCWGKNISIAICDKHWVCSFWRCFGLLFSLR